MRISMILSGGVGNRFGAAVPKQYSLLKGKPVIEYAIDACRLSKKTDKIIIVAAGKYVEELRLKYGLETCEGGKERNNSVKNGLDYIAEHYDCDKVVMVDAVSPLTTPEQIDKYFDLLDEYDIVQTATKVTTSVDRYDGEKVMRNDFYQTLEPEAYNFKMLFECFDGDNPSTTVYHQMPKEAKKYPCFDYPYNMKLTYAFDLKIAELLLEEEILKPRMRETMRKTREWISTIDEVAADQWLEDVWKHFEILRKKWEITSYSINPLSFTGLVIEGKSSLYGDVVVKFDSPVVGRYEGEAFYYKNARGNFMAEVIDYADEYCAILMKRVFPGNQVNFDSHDPKLKVFFDTVSESFVEISSKQHPELKTVMGNFRDYVALAREHSFEKEVRIRLEECCYELWDKYFKDSPEVLLHMDVHKRNILNAGEKYRGIDCQGVIGPKEFEYTRMFIIDNKDNRENTVSVCKDMFDFCKQYVSSERLSAALFIEWVFLLDEFVFADNDRYEAAAWALNAIEELFFNGSSVHDMDELHPSFNEC